VTKVSCIAGALPALTPNFSRDATFARRSKLPPFAVEDRETQPAMYLCAQIGFAEHPSRYSLKTPLRCGSTVNELRKESFLQISRYCRFFPLLMISDCYIRLHATKTCRRATDGQALAEAANAVFKSVL